jgi:hypothetical protein
MKHVPLPLKIPAAGHINVLVLGSSTAFPGLETFNQSMLIIFPDNTYGLIDCGEDTPKALIYHGVDIKRIRWVYISHLHADHCFGIPRLGLARYDFSRFPKHYSEGNYAPILFGKQQVLAALWDSVKAPLATLQNVQGTLETFFQPIPITTHFDWEGWNFRLIQQVHVVSDAEIMPSFGLIITKPGMKSIYLTTDSQFCSPRQVEDFYKLVDIIVQDCELIGVNTLFEEGQDVYLDKADNTWKAWPEEFMANAELMAKGCSPIKWARSKFFSGVHANFAQLAGYESANSTKLEAATKSKMNLSHTQDFKLDNVDMYGNPCDWDSEAKKAGFAGIVKTGDYFEL